MEHALINKTHFVAETFPTAPIHPDALTVTVKATFDLVADGIVRLAAGQLPFAGSDEHTGDPTKTAARYESDFVPFKPRADLLCVGKAYAPGRHPVNETLVRFGVAGWSKIIRVTGNRCWQAGPGGVHLSKPQPFQSLPVSYERAYGGVDPANPGLIFAPNPLGRGYAVKEHALYAPNLEDPRQPVQRPGDQRVPVGFGPVGRSWEPRKRLAGTFDENWLNKRSPALPEDFDLGYYNCAPKNQQIKGYLRGDESLSIDNMHPQHPRLRCRLPAGRVRTIVGTIKEGRLQLDEISMNLDTLWVDMESLKLVLVWRCVILAKRLDPHSPILIVAEKLKATPCDVQDFRSHFQQFYAKERDTEREFKEAEAEFANA